MPGVAPPIGKCMFVGQWMPRGGEHVVQRNSDVEDEQLRAAREWLWHLENGRIGSRLK